MTVYELPGEYYMSGTNQDIERSSYLGTLKLTLDEFDRINAVWNINDSQVQQGKGFFQDDVLVINFWYNGNDENVYKGVVVYRCLKDHSLDGFWSEKHGDQTVLGSEKCEKVNPYGKFSEN
jgi:hypothetical protein